MRYPLAAFVIIIAAILKPMHPAHAGPPVLDFSSAEVVATFRVINDAVMGGVSTSRLGAVAGAMRFEGEVSLENNGGFASFRGPVAIPVGTTAPAHFRPAGGLVQG